MWRWYGADGYASRAGIKIIKKLLVKAKLLDLSRNYFQEDLRDIGNKSLFTVSMITELVDILALRLFRLTSKMYLKSYGTCLFDQITVLFITARSSTNLFKRNKNKLWCRFWDFFVVEENLDKYLAPVDVVPSLLLCSAVARSIW